MNIFKKISLANKALKAYKQIKNHLENNHLTDEIKALTGDFKRDFERLIVLFPALKATYEEIKKVLNNI